MVCRVGHSGPACGGFGTVAALPRQLVVQLPPLLLQLLAKGVWRVMLLVTRRGRRRLLVQPGVHQGVAAGGSPQGPLQDPALQLVWHATQYVWRRTCGSRCQSVSRAVACVPAPRVPGRDTPRLCRPCGARARQEDVKETAFHYHLKQAACATWSACVYEVSRAVCFVPMAVCFRALLARDLMCQLSCVTCTTLTLLTSDTHTSRKRLHAPDEHVGPLLPWQVARKMVTLNVLETVIYSMFNDAGPGRRKRIVLGDATQGACTSRATPCLQLVIM